jgi:hypothetical protein
MTAEHLLQQEIKIWCGERNILVFRINVGTFRLYDGRWFTTGLPNGFPDLLLFSNDGKTIFVETKIKPKKPSKEQIEFLELMKNRGFKTILAYSLDDFIQQFNA